MRTRRRTLRVVPLLHQLEPRCLLSGYTQPQSAGYTPDQIARAYGLNAITFKSSTGSTIKGDGSGQTIALIEEYHDPNLQSDLRTFDRKYNRASRLAHRREPGGQSDQQRLGPRGVDGRRVCACNRPRRAHPGGGGGSVELPETRVAKPVERREHGAQHEGRRGDLDELGVQRDVQRGVLRQVLHDPRWAYGHHVHRLQWRLRPRRSIPRPRPMSSPSAGPRSLSPARGATSPRPHGSMAAGATAPTSRSRSIRGRCKRQGSGPRQTWLSTPTRVRVSRFTKPLLVQGEDRGRSRRGQASGLRPGRGSSLSSIRAALSPARVAWTVPPRRYRRSTRFPQAISTA